MGAFVDLGGLTRDVDAASLAIWGQCEDDVEIDLSDSEDELVELELSPLGIDLSYVHQGRSFDGRMTSTDYNKNNENFEGRHAQDFQSPPARTAETPTSPTLASPLMEQVRREMYEVRAKYRANAEATTSQTLTAPTLTTTRSTSAAETGENAYSVDLLDLFATPEAPEEKEFQLVKGKKWNRKAKAKVYDAVKIDAHKVTKDLEPLDPKVLQAEATKCHEPLDPKVREILKVTMSTQTDVALPQRLKITWEAMVKEEEISIDESEIQGLRELKCEVKHSVSRIPTGTQLHSKSRQRGGLEDQVDWMNNESRDNISCHNVSNILTETQSRGRMPSAPKSRAAEDDFVPTWSKGPEDVDGRLLRGAGSAGPESELVPTRSKGPECVDGSLLRGADIEPARPKGPECVEEVSCEEQVATQMNESLRAVEFLRTENLSLDSNPTHPHGSCMDLPPATDDDRQLSTLTPTRNKATQESKPKIDPILEYERMCARALEAFSTKNDEDDPFVEIEIADEQEIPGLGGSAGLNPFDVEPDTDQREPEEYTSDIRKLKKYNLEGYNENEICELPKTKTKEEIRLSKSQKKKAKKQERESLAAKTREVLPLPDPRGLPSVLCFLIAQDLQDVRDVVLESSDSHDVNCDLSVKVHGKSQFAAEYTGTAATPAVVVFDTMSMQLIVLTNILIFSMINVLDNLLENFLFLMLIMLKTFPAVHLMHCRDVFPREKALLTFPKISESEGGKSKIYVKRSIREKLAMMFRIKRGLTVDSGAADSVFPKSWVRQVLRMISKGMRDGLHYVAASGQRIPNEGEFKLKWFSKEGVQACLNFQLAAINKPLLSVSHATDNDYCVVFNKHEGIDVSYILHKPTDVIMRLRRERGVYILDAWTEEEISGETDSSFSRPR